METPSPIPARRTDPETSHAAAAQANVSAAEKAVLAALRDNPNGLTGHGLVSATGLPWNCCTPRVRPLVRKGLVKDSGFRAAYVGNRNRKCIIWQAV